MTFLPARRSRLALLLTAALLVAAFLVAGPASASTTIVADAYTNKASPNTNTNYGTANPLRVLKETTTTGMVAYLKFNSTDAGVGALRLYFSNVAAGASVEARSAPSTWTETGITWNNRPTPGTVLDTQTMPSSAGYVTFVNLPVAVGDNTFAVLSLSPSTTYQSFDSKESKKATQKPLLTVSPPPTTTTVAPTTTTVAPTTTTVAPTTTTSPPPPTSITTSKRHIYGGEVGAWRRNGNPAVDPASGIPTLLNDAKVSNIRYSLVDCFTGTTCGSDNHNGTLDPAQFDHAIQGITGTIGVPLLIKFPPIDDTVDGVNHLPFCAPWTGDASGNAPFINSVLDRIYTNAGYHGPIMIELPGNEVEFDCISLWRTQSGQPTLSSGGIGVSKRIGEWYAALAPQVLAHARALGFSEVVSVGENGIAGGPGWGQACTPDPTKPYQYACGYQGRWIGEFWNALLAAYQAPGGGNPDVFPQVDVIHAYPHGCDMEIPTACFGGADYDGYVFDDNIALAFHRNWIIQARAQVAGIIDPVIPGFSAGLLFGIDEFSAGYARSTSNVWAGWSDPAQVAAFYSGWYGMLRGDGNLAGSRYWLANAFVVASNADYPPSIGGLYNWIRMDGQPGTPYPTIKAKSLEEYP